MQLNELTITQTQHGLRRKEFSALEVAEDCLGAITAQNTDLNAYVTVFDDVREQAREADRLLQGEPIGELPPLIGIPLAIKDNILMSGIRTTAGSRMLENYIGSYDATVIEKLKNNGSVFLGKTNMDEFAMGSSTETSFFGMTKNPRDTTRVPGGSSGGSAAAVSAHLAIAALGSDTGGSIRQPASFCGIVGMKPTYAAVSRHGLIAMASSLDQIGPMTKTVEDAAVLFSALAGKDARDATSGAPSEDLYRNIAMFPEEESESNLFKELTIGVPQEYFAEGLHPEVEKNIRHTITACESRGAKVVEISLPHARFALPVYYILVPSEVSANLARFDAIRYGHISESAETLLEVYEKSRQEGFGPEVKRRIMLGTYTLSQGYYDAYYLKAQKVRRLIREDFRKAFETVDVIVGPTTPTPAFRLGEHVNDPLSMYLADIYTVAMNLAGVPALSMPAGTVSTEEGIDLPVGLQLITPWFTEPRLFQIARNIEQILGNQFPSSK